MLPSFRLPSIGVWWAARRRRRPHLLFVLLLSLTAQGQTAAAGSGALITGHVVDARTGAPMARVLVQANGGQAVFSDGEGRFQLPSASGVTSLRFTKPGFSLSPEQRDSETLPVEPATASGLLEVELWPEAVLAGTVTSPDGDPLGHLTVFADRIVFQNGTRQIYTALATMTDAHGGFRMPVPAGDYILRTQYAPPDFARPLAILATLQPPHTANDATATIHITSGQELHFDLHAQLAAAVRINVPLDGGGFSDRSVSLTLTTADGVTFRPTQRVTPEGLSLSVPAGTYQLSARLNSPEGSFFGRQVLAVPDRESTSAPLHLEAMTTIPIEISVDPASAASSDGSRVSAPDASAMNLQLAPDATSAFEITNDAIHPSGRGAARAFVASPGTYRLAGGESAGWFIETATFGGVDLIRNALAVGSSAGSEPIRIVVTRGPGSVSGVTRIGQTASRCWIVIVPEGDTLPRFLVRRSDAAGNFRITDLPLRSFRLLALPLLMSADFGQAATLDRFHTYVQTISVTTSSAAPLTLEAVPVHELYP